MGKTKDFLDSLDHNELAYFYKYKLTTYTAPTQSLIIEYMSKRGMNKSISDNAIKMDLHNVSVDHGAYDRYKCCPHCGSDKIGKGKVYIGNRMRGEGDDDSPNYTNRGAFDDLEANIGTGLINNLFCNVCGYDVFNPNKQESSFEVIDVIDSALRGIKKLFKIKK